MYKWLILTVVGLAQAQYPYPQAAPPPPLPARTGPYPAAVLAPAPITYPYPGQTEGSKYLDAQLDAPKQPVQGGAAEAAPAAGTIPLDSKVSVQDGRLQYSHGFVDQSSGTSVSEQGKLLSTNDGWEYVIAKTGEYSYTSPEGIPIRVRYIADENGFRILPNN